MLSNGDDGAISEKLVRVKEQWARAGADYTGASTGPGKVRWPPGQHVTKDFPVLDLGVQPNLTEKD